MKKTIIKSHRIRTAELTSRTSENKKIKFAKIISRSRQTFERSRAFKGKTKLPKLSTVVGARAKVIKVAAEKKGKGKGINVPYTSMIDS